MVMSMSEVFRCLVVAACAAGAVYCYNQQKTEAAAEKASAEKAVELRAAAVKAEEEKQAAVQAAENAARMKSRDAVMEARRKAEECQIKDNEALCEEFTDDPDIDTICDRIEDKKNCDTINMFKKLSAEQLKNKIRRELITRGESKHTYWAHTSVGEIVILVEFALDEGEIVVKSRKLIKAK